MLNCFWTECCSFYFAVTPLEVSTMPFRKVLPALSFLVFLKLPEIFVLNECVNLGKEHPRRRSKLDQLGLNCEHFVYLKIHYPGANPSRLNSGSN